jgi:hypothetical protein
MARNEPTLYWSANRRLFRRAGVPAIVKMGLAVLTAVLIAGVILIG